MKKTNRNLMLCGMVFATALVISNVVTGKVLQTGIPLFGSTILLPGATICYAITFLMTDVVGEIWGRREAQTIVYWGFACQLVATGLIMLTQVLPASDPRMQDAYDMLLGQSGVFFIGSMTAYLLSQSWDVFVFSRVRSRVLSARWGSSRMRWIWNCASTMTSQIIDTIVFIGISFGIGFGWLFDPAMLPQLGIMMIGQYLAKFCLAVLDTPFFYLFTHRTHVGGDVGRHTGSKREDEAGKGPQVEAARGVRICDNG